MGFGIKSAPATFQRHMTEVLSGLQGLKWFVYLDNISSYGQNLQDYNTKLVEVFNCLRQHNLKLKVENAIFYKKIVYLGRTCSSEGIKSMEWKLCHSFWKIEIKS